MLHGREVLTNYVSETELMLRYEPSTHTFGSSIITWNSPAVVIKLLFTILIQTQKMDIAIKIINDGLPNKPFVERQKIRIKNSLSWPILVYTSD